MKTIYSSKVPFYANHADNMHCMLAVYRSIFDFFEQRKFDWDELEKLIGFENGRAAWTVKILSEMARGPYDIEMIEPFDYARYLTEGESYLHELMSPAKLKWMLEHSNILDMDVFIPDFLRDVQYACRIATNDDISRMLAGGRLVFVTLNSKALNEAEGYSDHAVLVIDERDEDFIIHDPGLPPRPYRVVAKSLLHKARGGDRSTGEVTGFKLKKPR